MEEFYAKMSETNAIPGDTGFGTNTTTGGFRYWDDTNWSNEYPPYQWRTWNCPTENKIEKAYNVIKKLVELDIIPEPKTYKKFCSLIEKIAKVL